MWIWSSTGRLGMEWKVRGVTIAIILYKELRLKSVRLFRCVDSSSLTSLTRESGVNTAPPILFSALRTPYGNRICYGFVDTPGRDERDFYVR